MMLAVCLAQRAAIFGRFAYMKRACAFDRNSILPEYHGRTFHLPT